MPTGPHPVCSGGPSCPPSPGVRGLVGECRWEYGGQGATARPPTHPLLSPSLNAKLICSSLSPQIQDISFCLFLVLLTDCQQWQRAVTGPELVTTSRLASASPCRGRVPPSTPVLPRHTVCPLTLVGAMQLYSGLPAAHSSSPAASPAHDLPLPTHQQSNLPPQHSTQGALHPHQAL